MGWTWQEEVVRARLIIRPHLGMSYSYYILLYTAIYDFCTQNRPSLGAFGTSGRGGASLQGADLYRSLHSYMSDHCRGLREVSSELPSLTRNLYLWITKKQR